MKKKKKKLRKKYIRLLQSLSRQYIPVTARIPDWNDACRHCAKTRKKRYALLKAEKISNKQK